MINLTLPFGPSVNGYWRSFKGRQIVSKHGREYRKKVCEIVKPETTLTCRLAVVLTLYPPDMRRRDVDNYCKSCLDALTTAGVWVDDSQIKDLRILMKGTARPPRIDVQIKEFEDDP